MNRTSIICLLAAVPAGLFGATSPPRTSLHFEPNLGNMANGRRASCRATDRPKWPCDPARLYSGSAKLASQLR